MVHKTSMSMASFTTVTSIYIGIKRKTQGFAIALQPTNFR